MRLLAGLDQTAAARQVLIAAREIARMFGAEVSAVHVVQDGVERVRELAAECRVPLLELGGRAGPALTKAVEQDDEAIALVVGTRARAKGDREIGSTALEVVTTAHKPVFAIPPALSAEFAIHRVLVPLEGSLSTSFAPYSALDVPGVAHVDVVILHVLDEDALPPFSDQPQHEWDAFQQEFLTRYSPWPVEHVRLETRVGRAEQHVLAVAAELLCDLIALGWTQELAPGRATLVRRALRAGTIPVLLVPMRAVEEEFAEAVPTA
jgi:nucleotide-binding universal stress UspA family protein